MDGVETIKDLEPGMVLEGTVTNVTNFGAFVDIGVHQDGLVHISALAEKFIKDPRDVVKAGDIVKVKVMEVEVARNRIALSMRMGDEPGQEGKQSAPRQQRPANKPNGKPNTEQRSFSGKAPAPKGAPLGSMGALLQQAMKNKK
jgi:uncharacterized protein